MKAKILSTVEIKQEWLDEIAEHIPGIEFEIHRTRVVLKTWWNNKEGSFFGVFEHLRQIVNAPTGYKYRVYVMSERQRKDSGIGHYGCYDDLDRDGVLDFYMSVGDTSKKTAKNGFKYNFARRFCHEVLHGKEQEMGANPISPDRTHPWEAEGRLKELLAEHFKRDELLKKLSMIEVILNLLKVKFSLQKPIAAEVTLLHPVPTNYRDKVTQRYGLKNALYKLSGHHIGTDYATALGTPLQAPWDGKITAAGFTQALGNFCHYQYTYRGKQYTDRYLHLRHLPLVGNYKRGTIIARTGNTGLSTGPHLHAEIWEGDVDLSSINSNNWSELTRDPQTHYGI